MFVNFVVLPVDPNSVSAKVAILLCLCVFGFICGVCVVVSHLSFFWCLARAMLRDCRIYCLSSLICYELGMLGVLG